MLARGSPPTQDSGDGSRGAVATRRSASARARAARHIFLSFCILTEITPQPSGWGVSEGVGGAGRERDRRDGAGERGQREPSLRSWELRGRRNGREAPASTASGSTREVAGVHASVGHESVHRA